MKVFASYVFAFLCRRLISKCLKILLASKYFRKSNPPHTAYLSPYTNIPSPSLLTTPFQKIPCLGDRGCSRKRRKVGRFESLKYRKTGAESVVGTRQIVSRCPAVLQTHLSPTGGHHFWLQNCK
jgi:hypothetical protein